MRKTWIVLATSILLCPLTQFVALQEAQATPPEKASVRNIRYRMTEDSVQINIDLDSATRYESQCLENPDRIFFDIFNAVLKDDFQNRAMPIHDPLLKRIRVAQNLPDVVRVVLDISGKTDYLVSELQNPSRIVIELRSSPGSKKELKETPAQSASSPMEPVLPVPSIPASTGQSATIAPENAIPIEVKADVPSSAVADAEPQPSVPNPTDSALSIYAALSNFSPSTDIERESAALSQDGTMKTVLQPPAANFKKKEDSREREIPLTIEGTLSSGYYDSFSRGGANQDHNIHFIPTGVTFDINGFYKSPDLLDYSIRTELNSGARANDAGFDGGNGARMKVTTFRRGLFPISFHYANMQLKDVYFGSLTQVSSYTLKNRNKDLGLTVGLNIAALPKITVDWGTGSARSQAFHSEIPDYSSESRHLNLSCNDKRWKWDFQCFAEHRQQVSDLYTPYAQGSNSSLLQQIVRQYRGSARRSFFSDFEFYMDGGSQSTSNIVLDQPIDVATRYANMNLRLFQKKWWRTSLRAGYTSNITGLALTQVLDGLGSSGSIAPDSSVLQSFRRTTSYLNFNGRTSLDLPGGLSLYGSTDRTSVLTDSGSGLNSRYLTTAAGATYAQTFRWGSFSGQYGRTLGFGSIAGESGRIAGQNYLFTAQPGKPQRLLFDFTVRGSDRSVHNEMPAREHSLAADMGVGFSVYGRVRARMGGGWQRTVFTNQGNEYQLRGYTARIGIEHPLFQLNGSLNTNVGASLQTYSEILNQTGAGSTLLAPLRLVPNDLQGVTLSLHATPIRKIEFSALYTRSIQHLENIVANDFEIIDVSATFHFRKLQFVAGYFLSTQIYSSNLATYPETERGRFYLRIRRKVKFL